MLNPSVAYPLALRIKKKLLPLAHKLLLGLTHPCLSSFISHQPLSPRVICSSHPVLSVPFRYLAPSCPRSCVPRTLCPLLFTSLTRALLRAQLICFCLSALSPLNVPGVVLNSISNFSFRELLTIMYSEPSSA